MFQAAKAFSKSPDPDTKLGDLESMDLAKLEMLLTRYKNIAGNRRLVGRLRDGGEAARRAQAAVEAELARRRAAPAPVPQTATVQQLTEQLQRMEWSSGRPPPPGGAGEVRGQLDSDDDPDPSLEDGPEPCLSRLWEEPSVAVDHPPGSASRHILTKSATSRRCPRFQTNQPRPAPVDIPPLEGSASAPGMPTSPQSRPAGAGILQHWGDSVLAAPARPNASTRLLNMDESLQLLTDHEQQIQVERMGRLMTGPMHETADDDDVDDESMSDGDSSEGVPVCFRPWSR